MGLSGSGKSTLVRTLIRLIEPSAGKIRITGQTLWPPTSAQLRDLRRHTVAMVSSALLLAHRSSSTTWPSGSRSRGAEGRAARPRRRRCSASSASRMPPTSSRTSSRGYAAARGASPAPCLDPTLMLYDEPLSALDPLSAAICRTGHPPSGGTGKTMLFVTHDLPEALRLGDRIAIMRDRAIAARTRGAGRLARRRLRRNFTRDIPHPRAHAALDHARPAPRRGAEGPELDMATTVRDAVRWWPRPTAGRAVEEGRVVRVIDREAVLLAMARAPRRRVAVADGRLAAPAAFAPSTSLARTARAVAGIVPADAVGFTLFHNEFRGRYRSSGWSFPSGSTTSDLAPRAAHGGHPNIIFAIFDGFHALAESLVTALDDFLLWLTWVGTIAASSLCCASAAGIQRSSSPLPLSGSRFMGSRRRASRPSR